MKQVTPHDKPIKITEVPAGNTRQAKEVSEERVQRNFNE